MKKITSSIIIMFFLMAATTARPIANDKGTSLGSIVDLDDDNDGVANQYDKCPYTPAGMTVDANGCAADLGETPSDTDGDGVSNAFDMCPGTPYGTPVNSSGCPL